jgi:hypothetical protein
MNERPYEIEIGQSRKLLVVKKNWIGMSPYKVNGVSI